MNETNKKPFRLSLSTLSGVLTSLWLLGALLVVCAALFSEKYRPEIYQIVYMGATLVMSGATFFLFSLDKLKARRESGSRISEKTLLIFCAICGWPGGVLAQILVRHKSSKIPFRIWLWFIMSVHLFMGGWIFLVWVGLL